MSAIVTAGEIATAFGDAAGNYMGGTATPAEKAAVAAATSGFIASILANGGGRRRSSGRIRRWLRCRRYRIAGK